MKFPFLHNFQRRMKIVGLYNVIFANSSQKYTWKQFGFENNDEQICFVFAVLLYIMEQSLKKEICTLDDIAHYICEINSEYFAKNLAYGECYTIGDFVVNDILTNGGVRMSFRGYNFDTNTEEDIFINYIESNTFYDTRNTRRTTFSMTREGYLLIFNTLEIENNMRISYQQLILEKHLQSCSYDKALEDIKELFRLLHIEKQNNEEAQIRIRRDILQCSSSEYNERLDNTFQTLNETREKLQNFKEIVASMYVQMESDTIDFEHINKRDMEKLQQLKAIQGYLDKTLDYSMDTLKSLQNYRDLCEKEYNNIFKHMFIDRVSFSRDILEKVLDDGTAVTRIDAILHPLFNRNPDKIYNINKALIPQHVQEEQESTHVRELDVEAWQKEQERIIKEKDTKYRMCLKAILESVAIKGSVTLKELRDRCAVDHEYRKRLIPDVRVFTEIMLELLQRPHIIVENLRKEHRLGVHLDANLKIGAQLVSIIDNEPDFYDITQLNIQKLEERDPVIFDNISDNYLFVCTDTCITAVN